MVQVIGDVYRTAVALVPAGRAATRVVCSVAAYVDAGQPAPRAGGAYTQLHRVAGTSDVAGWLENEGGRDKHARTIRLGVERLRELGDLLSARSGSRYAAAWQSALRSAERMQPR